MTKAKNNAVTHSLQWGQLQKRSDNLNVAKKKFKTGIDAGSLRSSSYGSTSTSFTNFTYNITLNNTGATISTDVNVE